MKSLEIIAAIMFFIGVVVNMICEFRCVERAKIYERIEKENEERKKEDEI